MNRHAEFLAAVENYITRNPDAAAYVSDFVSAGLQTALASAHERAADMEVALSVQLAKRYPAIARQELTRDKLKKWEGKTALAWNWFTEVKP